MINTRQRYAVAAVTACLMFAVAPLAAQDGSQRAQVQQRNGDSFTLHFRQADINALIATVSDSWLIQIMLVDLLIILLGTVLDVLPAMVVSAPVLVPAMVSLGFDPLHFAIVMILTLNVANITPPVGMTLMTAAKIADVPYERAILESLPFFVSHMVVILLVAFFPRIALWLPSLLH
jgi:TRAP-type C4-dicarboxylate transport system permease large subunit